MTLTFSDSLFDEVDSRVVTIGGDFVTNQMPNPLLDIEFGMVRWQVLDFDVGMRLEEVADSIPFMPGSSVDIEIDFGFAHTVTEAF